MSQPNNLHKAGLIGVDIEQLKGRPAFAALLKTNQRTEAKLKEIMWLVREQSVIQGLGFRLHVECRPLTQAPLLKWRKGTRAIVWKKLDVELDLLTAPVRARVEQINRRAEELNVLSVIVSHTIRWCEVHLGKREMRQGQKRAKTTE